MTDGFYREANIESHDTRNWGNDTFALAMNLTMDAVTEV